MTNDYNPEAANYSAGTSRRLMDIARRNEVRREAKLALLSVAKELRDMKKQEELEEFSRFESVHHGAILEEMLKRIREANGNANWRPSFMEGMVLLNQVHGVLWEQFLGTTVCQASQSAVATARRGYHAKLSQLSTPNNYFAKCYLNATARKVRCCKLGTHKNCF